MRGHGKNTVICGTRGEAEKRADRLRPGCQRVVLRCFKMTSLFSPQVKPVFFTEMSAPDWLTTMDLRWFWRDHVMTLPIGGSVDTDFQRIERIAPYVRVYRDELRQRQRQLCGRNSKFAVLHLGEFLRD